MDLKKYIHYWIPILLQFDVIKLKSVILTKSIDVHYHSFTFTFSHLADAFIQSDLQLGST